MRRPRQWDRADHGETCNQTVHLVPKHTRDGTEHVAVVEIRSLQCPTPGSIDREAPGAEMIAMALSLDNFLIAFFTIGGDNTLPTMLRGMLRKGLDPRINVVALILISLTTTASIVAMRITRYRG